MKSITIFDVVLVPFPFADLKAAKQRPCLVLAKVSPQRLEDHFIVAMITSQLGEQSLRFPSDVLLKQHDGAGLPKPSLVRLSKVVTLETALIRKKLGSLQSLDRRLVRQQFRFLFSELV
ncbi:MAG: type II toxin-antitoxin system PemK/MazF family toxin [Deltaproteobacteria bacterium]|nr:type II toxin-antitoxin system PemK/MazF family toxin [Deltaproteobacteria bacterium]